MMPSIIDHKKMKYRSRKSPRLAGYEYSNAGYYFVTICTHRHECIFGSVKGDDVHLNPVGQMIGSLWRDMPRLIAGIDLDAFVVMPNHIHGVIILDGGVTLSRVIQGFKSVSTNEYIRRVHEQGWKKFDRILWQRSFYDHVIRNDKDLFRVQEYIVNNPLSWSIDDENPDRQKNLSTGRTQGPPLRSMHS